jgi:hypothetical protein
VLKFNLSDIPGLPDNANITEATFSIYFLEGDTGDGTLACSLYVISKYWNSKEVTWNNATKTDKWEQLDLDTKYFDPISEDTVWFTGGGDRIFPHAATTPVSTASRKWETYTVTDVIKKYLKNPDSFYGFLVKPYANNKGRIYASSEYAEEDKRPKLTIKYSGTGIKQSPKENITSPRHVTITPKTVRIYIPLPDNYQVTISDLKGRRLHSFNGRGGKWYDIPRDYLNTGMHILRVFTTGHLEIIDNFLVVR